MFSFIIKLLIALFVIFLAGKYLYKTYNKASNSNLTEVYSNIDKYPTNNIKFKNTIDTEHNQLYTPSFNNDLNQKSDNDVDQESDNDVDQESDNDVDQESDNDVDQESDNDVDQESDNDVDQESKKDVHQDSDNDVDQESDKDVHQDSDNDVDQESDKNVHQESDNDVDQESEKDLVQTVEQETENNLIAKVNHLDKDTPFLNKQELLKLKIADLKIYMDNNNIVSNKKIKKDMIDQILLSYSKKI